MPGALEGVRILDFTRYQQGPFATVLLSDLGAEVIKVEEPTHGDLGRSLGLQPDGWCSYFQALNRNKRSLTVDTRTPEGREIIYRLIPETDVVTDNFRPGTMKRFGLDHESLAAINPRIITASASGFGPRVRTPTSRPSTPSARPWAATWSPRGAAPAGNLPSSSGAWPTRSAP